MTPFKHHPRGSMTCRMCGSEITSHHGKARFKRRGYGYCSYQCDANAKKQKAYEDSSMRFMHRVRMAGEGECWEYTGTRNKNGYGVFDWRGPDDARVRPHLAHRMMWLIVCGSIPVGQEVCHACDNPICCNPNHLWLGTQRENIHDMIKKGRGHWQGAKSHVP